MSRSSSVRTYGKKTTKPRARRLLEEIPVNIVNSHFDEDPISSLTDKISTICIDDQQEEKNGKSGPESLTPTPASDHIKDRQAEPDDKPTDEYLGDQKESRGLRILSWLDVCPIGDRIEKIAEASYAEVYRITNERGTSIIKVIRLDSPIKPQTKAQIKSGLVDEEPHCEDDLLGELKISEWLADIPGFVVYKERYLIQGKSTAALLETHQSFHRKMKRQDPDRIQFYPSPSRYLDDTRFLVVELGDAGISLEDVELQTTDQLWDIFLNVAVALARAEDQINFEVCSMLSISQSLVTHDQQHRDLHEGNLCIRQVAQPRQRMKNHSACQFGYSGLDITILDYGLSRAQDLIQDEKEKPISFDLERDLSLFTSTHATQCKVYRQMRSFLLTGDRVHLPPEEHNTPYEVGVNGQITWEQYNPYTNVLWLAYIYHYLTKHFRGDKADLSKFKKTTKEMWTHLNPEAPPEILSFSSAFDVVRFAVDAGWITETQLMGDKSELQDADGADESCNASIIEVPVHDEEPHLRRSPRRRIRPAN